MDRVSIEKLNICAASSFKFESEKSESSTVSQKCSLCKLPLTSPTYDNLRNGNLNVEIEVGLCNHAFHKQCISNHLKNSLSCPIDQTPYKFINNYIIPFDNIDNSRYSKFFTSN